MLSLKRQMLRSRELHILRRKLITFFNFDIIRESLQAYGVLQLTRSGCSFMLDAESPISQP